MKQRAIILGAGGHAVSLAETVVACGYELVGFVGVPRRGPSIFGIPIIPEVPADHLGNGGVLVMAEGGNWQREQATHALIDTPVTNEVFPALIHPSASVSHFAELGPGVVVLQGAVVGAGTQVGSMVVINSAASVDHECHLHDFSSVGPGAILGGGVSLGRRSVVGIGAVVKQLVQIGDDTVLGAQSYANGDLPARVVAYGTPARVVRTRIAEDPYLG